MTDSQKRFVEEYVIDCNGAAAAIRAGYSKKTAKQEAYQLKNDPEVRRAIEERFKQLHMSAEEAAKHITDIARTRLNDYLKVEKVPHTPMVRKPLQKLIDELQAEIDLEEDFARQAGLEEKELEDHLRDQKRREWQMLRYRLELSRNPKAYRDVPGETVWIERVQPDLVALTKAKEEGRIKSLSFTEHGPKVELYGADSALEKILQMNGKLIQRHDHTSKGLGFGDFLKAVSTTENAEGHDTDA